MALQEQLHEDPGHQHGREVTVEITIDDVTRMVKVRAGLTEVSQLKAELGVPEQDSLFQTAPVRRPLADHETIEVTGGERFEAVHGGGVS